MILKLIMVYNNRGDIDEHIVVDNRGYMFVVIVFHYHTTYFKILKEGMRSQRLLYSYIDNRLDY